DHCEDSEQQPQRLLPAGGLRNEPVERIYADYRLLSVELQDFRAYRFIQASRIAVGAQDQRHEREGLLRVWLIDLRGRLAIQTIGLYIAGHADDLAINFIPVGQLNALADRVFIREKLLRHRIVDDGDARGAFCIAPGEMAASQQWNSNGFEIIG